MKPVLLQQSANKKGHYVPGVISHGMLYVSGQLPVDPATGAIVTGGVVEHTRATLDNVERVLTAAGLTKAHVVQCRVYIPNVADWDAVNDAYAAFFGPHKPARVIVPSRALHHGALVEIEAVAELEAE